jgi:hypothetical protein
LGLINNWENFNLYNKDAEIGPKILFALVRWEGRYKTIQEFL